MRQFDNESLTGRVIACFYAVYNELGFGYPESVYAAALDILLRDAGISARREHSFDVIFRGAKISSYRLDFLVEDHLVLELKAAHSLPAGSKDQLLTYLRTSKKKLGLLLFFGPVPDVQRAEL